MRSIYYYLPVILIAVAVCGSCGSGNIKKIDTAQRDQAISAPNDTPTDITDIDTSQYATVYVVIADTGMDYYSLRNKMFGLYAALKWPIDTMGRYYNKNKKEIVLPDDDEDELYRGEYFPRRGQSATLSLEYYKYYNEYTTPKNIALVASISDTQAEADSLLTILNKEATNSFVYKTKMYMGCMH